MEFDIDFIRFWDVDNNLSHLLIYVFFFLTDHYNLHFGFLFLTYFGILIILMFVFQILYYNMFDFGQSTSSAVIWKCRG